MACTMHTNISSTVEQYIQHIIDLSSNEISLDGILEQALEGDRELRRLFASNPRDPCLSDLHLGLIDVFKLPALARRTRARNAIPGSATYEKRYVFPLRPNQRRPHLSPSIVPTFDAFVDHWEIFSHNALTKMKPSNWQNVIVAGGSVLACLVAQYPRRTSPEEINAFFLGNAWGISDIDLFLWGLSPEQAVLKIREIYNVIRLSAPWPITCVRKANVISFHTRFPHRPIQIILRLYDTPTQILAGFDVDAACCAFDGQTVWVNPRSLTAILRQTNTIDISRRSPSYELRLAKYAERGFEVFIPSLSRNIINPLIYDRNLQQFPKGLARLLVLERLSEYHNPYIFLQYPRTRAHVEDKVISNDEDPLEGTISDAEVIEKSFYESDLRWCQIPYGPFWDAKRIERVILKKAEWLNSRWNKANGGQETHKHVIFAGSLDKCINGRFCTMCTEAYDQSSSVTELDPNTYIRGPVKFISINPGRQLLTGSFQPINDDEWEVEAYARTREMLDYANSINEILHSVAVLYETAADIP